MTAINTQENLIAAITSDDAGLPAALKALAQDKTALTTFAQTYPNAFGEALKLAVNRETRSALNQIPCLANVIKARPQALDDETEGKLEPFLRKMIGQKNRQDITAIIELMYLCQLIEPMHNTLFSELNRAAKTNDSEKCAALVGAITDSPPVLKIMIDTTAFRDALDVTIRHHDRPSHKAGEVLGAARNGTLALAATVS